MKLNKLQRHTAYIIMMEEAKKPRRFEDYGLCELSFDVLGLHAGDGWYWVDNIEMFFPELWAKRPKEQEYYQGWFSHDKIGWQKRIELLKQCIEETY